MWEKWKKWRNTNSCSITQSILVFKLLRTIEWIAFSYRIESGRRQALRFRKFVDLLRYVYCFITYCIVFYDDEGRKKYCRRILMAHAHAYCERACLFLLFLDSFSHFSWKLKKAETLAIARLGRAIYGTFAKLKSSQRNCFRVAVHNSAPAPNNATNGSSWMNLIAFRHGSGFAIFWTELTNAVDWLAFWLKIENVPKPFHLLSGIIQIKNCVAPE